MQPVSTVIADKVVLNWNAPVDNGMPITGYNVYIQKSDNTFVTELVNCDGSQTQIKTTTECTIPLSILTAAPFSLTLGSEINAKLTAYNAYGESTES